jgi:thioredoxin 1
MAIESVIHTNRHSIDRVLGAGLPVLLIFWDANHPLPAALNSALDQLARQFAGKALLAKVDAAEERELRQRYRADELPSGVLVKGGQVEVVLPASARADEYQAWLVYAAGGGARPAVATKPQAGPEAGGSPVILTDANFQQVTQGPGPVLVDFWAPWCGPCRMVAPSVERLAREYAGRVVVAKLNTDENPATARRYQIMSIPALYIFKNGQVVDQMVGAQPYQVLEQHLRRFVG